MAYAPGIHGCSKIWKALLIFVILLAAVMSNAASAQAVTCAYSSGSWANTALSQSQGSTFRITYDATPSALPVNAISGLSSVNAQQYSDLATGVRFNPSGLIDVRNGSTFTAANPVRYQAGITYHFILDVNVSSHTYSAYVLLGSGQITLGTNVAFRTEQASVAVLNTVDAFASAGAISICNIALSSSSTPVAASPSPLIANVSSLSFGNTGLASSTQKNVTLTNTGSSSVTISGVSVSGAGFTASGASGLIVSPSQSTTVHATFTPFTIGSYTGSLTITSNAQNSPAKIVMSGTGVASATHSVTLSWNSSSSVVAGYNVYVSSSSSGPYSLLNSSPVPTTSYVDSNVQSGDTYYFRITSVSTSYQESAPSTTVQATIP
jgi:hypothetical protein